MLILRIPGNAASERRYIAQVVLHHYLGLEFQVRRHDSREVILEDGRGKRLIMDDSFFSDLDGEVIQRKKMPSLPLERWEAGGLGPEVRLAGSEVPVLFGRPFSEGNYISFGDGEVRLGIDVLGSAFFMLSRYEELASGERDSYDRFPASASIAYKAGFLDRPIVNEYVELLWHCITRLWNGLVRRERRFRVILSHDVDQPFQLLGKNFIQVARAVAGDALKRRDPLGAAKRPVQWVAARVAGPHHDPAFTFRYIMSLAEKYGLRSAFYFIPSLSAGPPDYRYGIYDPHIQSLMRELHARGHELGYHASIETYQDGSLIRKELELLRQACDKLKIAQTSYGGRQHYLRVRVPVTLRYLTEAHVSYDTTLGFADHVGFRCGTCWEYPFYDLEERKALPIIERPLIAMEGSALDQNYMGLGAGKQAFDVLVGLAKTCRLFSGDFTLLWHNNRLIHPQERRLFEGVVGEICRN